MKIYNYDIVFQEVPDEITLCITVCGCKLQCKGCHSPHTWNNSGYEFTLNDLQKLVSKYKDYISCVCFMGGEWHRQQLANMLHLVKAYNLKTCLYTGETKITEDILKSLDYIKLGPWIEELGGLNSLNTNQIFLDLNNNKILNYKFIK